MMTGAEKTAWDSTPRENSPLLVEIKLTEADFFLSRARP
jgi:hypothetical protein